MDLLVQACLVALLIASLAVAAVYLKTVRQNITLQIAVKVNQALTLKHHLPNQNKSK